MSIDTNILPEAPPMTEEQKKLESLKKLYRNCWENDFNLEYGLSEFRDDWDLPDKEFQDLVEIALHVVAEEKQKASRNGKEPNPTDKSKKKLSLPPIRTMGEIVKSPPQNRPEVIKGVLRQRCKMSIGGAAKARKSWQLMNLAVSAATGQEWLKFETIKTKTLFINLELHEDTFLHRIQRICEGMEVSINDISENLSAWCLRGHAASWDVIIPMILNEIKDKEFGLVIFDPTQKILGDLEENRSSDINKLMNELEKVCFETGAALAITLHYSKGNKANTQAGERSRGSSVYIGDVDAAIEFVQQDESDATGDVLVAELVLREFPPVSPFCVKWDGHALFNLSKHDPSKKKKQNGRKTIHTEMDLIAALRGKELTASEWQQECNTHKGIGKTRFYELKKNLDGGNVVAMNAETQKYRVV